MEQRVKEIINQSGYLKASYDRNKMKDFVDVYDFLCDYAYQNELLNTAVSLNLVSSFLCPENLDDTDYIEDVYTRSIYADHAISIAKIIIDLHPSLTKEEEDLALSCALCHVLVEKINFENHGDELHNLFKLDERVNELIHINLRKDFVDESFYEKIQRNKLALLVKLADRSNIVQTLYLTSIDDAQKYARDTKKHFFDMCLYGKNHYPELTMAITILMEKMRYLVDVSDILTTRFKDRENKLNNEILNLKEENARIRASIKQLQK